MLNIPTQPFQAFRSRTKLEQLLFDFGFDLHRSRNEKREALRFGVGDVRQSRAFVVDGPHGLRDARERSATSLAGPASNSSSSSSSSK